MDSLIEAESRLNSAIERQAEHNVEQALHKESARQRQERRKRENLEAWLEHHDRLANVHEDLAAKHREDYEVKRAILERGLYG